MRPMLLPGAGIYMVRGGGSCGDKHRVGDKGQVLEASWNKCSGRSRVQVYAHQPR